MIPDISLDECIEILRFWIRDAMKSKKETGDFEYVIAAHTFNEILKHLKAYKELKEKVENDENNESIGECLGSELPVDDSTGSEC